MVYFSVVVYIIISTHLDSERAHYGLCQGIRSTSTTAREVREALGGRGGGRFRCLGHGVFLGKGALDQVEVLLRGRPQWQARDFEQRALIRTAIAYMSMNTGTPIPMRMSMAMVVVMCLCPWLWLWSCAYGRGRGLRSTLQAAIPAVLAQLRYLRPLVAQLRSSHLDSTAEHVHQPRGRRVPHSAPG